MLDLYPAILVLSLSSEQLVSSEQSNGFWPSLTLLRLSQQPPSSIADFAELSQQWRCSIGDSLTSLS